MYQWKTHVIAMGFLKNHIRVNYKSRLNHEVVVINILPCCTYSETFFFIQNVPLKSSHVIHYVCSLLRSCSCIRVYSNGTPDVRIYAWLPLLETMPQWKFHAFISALFQISIRFYIRLGRFDESDVWTATFLFA